MPAAGALMVRDGLRLFSPAAALVRVPESFFQLCPVETQVVMASLADASDLLRLLLNGGHSAKAGYLAKAFRQTGRRPRGRDSSRHEGCRIRRAREQSI